MVAPSSPTLDWLLSRPELALRPAAAGDEAARRTAIRWVHSSELADPTPFLGEGMVLLTTGTQFAGDGADPAAYVDRLVAHGVVALGFGTEVVREGIPPLLVAAAAARGLPVFEVPYRTPFIAVARAVADAIAAHDFARREWALAAQRAIAGAALRSDGLGTMIAETARQLGCWVGVFDASGALARESDALPDSAERLLAGRATALLDRSRSSVVSLLVDDAPFLLQTLGPGRELRGVLAIAAESLDDEARGVVAGVVAMTGFALGQNENVARERAAMRSGVIHALLRGDSDLAALLSTPLPNGLPAGDLLVAVADGASEELTAFLELRSARARSGFFFGSSPDTSATIILLPSPSGATPLLDAIGRRFGLRIGLSRPVPIDRFPDAVAEATLAGARQPVAGVARYSDLAGQGMLAALGDDARRWAGALLDPLLRYDAEHAAALVTTLRTWLDQDASIERTSTALGIHRHTVRGRVQLAERVLGTDLGSFAARADLWLALRAIA